MVSVGAFPHSQKRDLAAVALHQENGCAFAEIYAIALCSHRLGKIAANDFKRIKTVDDYARETVSATDQHCITDTAGDKFARRRKSLDAGRASRRNYKRRPFKFQMRTQKGCRHRHINGIWLDGKFLHRRIARADNYANASASVMSLRRGNLFFDLLDRRSHERRYTRRIIAGFNRAHSKRNAQSSRQLRIGHHQSRCIAFRGAAPYAPAIFTKCATYAKRT